MKSLKKLSYRELKERRDLMVNAKVFSIDDEDRAVFDCAIQGLDDAIYRRQIRLVRSAVIAVNVLVLLNILVSGCNLAREGLYGTGRCIGALGEDVKWTADKLAGNIQTENRTGPK